jgi:AraC-like DNA-binding protein
VIASTAEIEHVVAAPAAPLTSLIRRYIGYRYSRLAPGRHLGLPSPDLTVVISLGPRTELAAMPDPRQRPAAFDALVGGLHTRPAVLAHSGELSGIELDLTPAGARSLLGVPAGELGNAVVGFGEVIGSASAELLEKSAQAATWPERFASLDRFLCGRLESLRPVRPELESAWQLIVSSGGAGRISGVAETVGWSRRHLHERFLAEYGVSPKQLASITRFHRSRRMLQRSPSANLAEVAAACGYYDQAHLARDWNVLAGCAPSRWMRTDELPFVQDGSHSDPARLSA